MAAERNCREAVIEVRAVVTLEGRSKMELRAAIESLNLQPDLTRWASTFLV